jgi:hypothetical protein
MRTPLAALVVILVAGCGEKKPAKIRFLFDVETSLAGRFEITIGGRPVTIDPPTANVRTSSGFVDFASSEIKADARPEIRLRSACGDRFLRDNEMERKPPNDHNVVVFTLAERLMPEPAFTAVIDPEARSVKIGTYEVTSRADRLTFFDSCAFTITVDGQTHEMSAPASTGQTLLVAKSPSTCLSEGVVVYATPGATCAREWAERHTGQLAYWGRVYPAFAFEPLPDSRSTRSQNACIEHGFVQRC